MTWIRDHSIFNVIVEIDTRDRIEDEDGDTVGFGDAYRITREFTVIAPSKRIAEAWVLDRTALTNPHVLSISEKKFDAFLQDHTW